MIILDAVTKSLKVVLAGAVAATQLPVTAHYTDITTTAYTPGSNDTVTNSTSVVEFVAAPAASTQRHVESISVYNVDTASAAVTIQYVSAGGTRQIIKVALLTLEALYYEDGTGWQTIDANGNIKSTFAGMVSDTAYAASWDAVTGVAPSKNAVYDQIEAHKAVQTSVHGLAITAGKTLTVSETSTLTTELHVTAPATHIADGATGFTIAGGTTSKTLTVDETVAMSSKAPTASPALVTPNLGTPSAGTLTSCTGLPAAGIVPGTAESDFLIATTTPFTWVKKTLAEARTILFAAMGNIFATTVNKITITQPANGSTLTIADGKTLTVSETSTLTTELHVTAPATHIADGATGFTIAGGTTSKTLTVDETVAMSSKAPKATPTFTGQIRLADTNTSAKGGMGIKTVNTQGVAQSATEIMSINITPNANGTALVLVSGTKGTASFFDLVVASDYDNSVVVLTSSTTYGSPDARTYSFEVSALKLLLAAGTYNITAVAIEAGYQN